MTAPANHRPASADLAAAEIATLHARNAELEAALELIAGKRGEYSMPWPETQEGYGAFAVVTARATLASRAPAEAPRDAALDVLSGEG